jgi:hypothetical protein
MRIEAQTYLGIPEAAACSISAFQNSNPQQYTPIVTICLQRIIIIQSVTIMSLSFVTGTWQLATWGFSAGDVALLAGAGRSAGNWLIAQLKDRALLDFMSIDIDQILTRKGLIDTVSLHQRWDVKLRLLQNNKPVTIKNPQGHKVPIVENMDRFTWIMTLITAALDAALSASCLQTVISGLLEDLFQEAPVGLEYLHHELPLHIQGWRSSACVRGVLDKANRTWSALADRGTHWPGKMPPDDSHNLVDFLKWLLAGDRSMFATGSSDVFSIASVLGDLGMEVCAIASPNSVDESCIHVVLDSNLVTSQGPNNKEETSIRWGMRVPLNFMQECVSLWPGDIGSTNELRRIFEDGMQAVESDGVTVIPTLGPSTLSFYIHTCLSSSQRRRLSSRAFRLQHVFLPEGTDAAASTLGRLTEHWPEQDKANLDTALRNYEQIHDMASLETVLAPTSIAQLQTFLLGFYYKLTKPLIDVSRLAVMEGVGSWGYHDGACLRRFAMFKEAHKRITSKGKDFERSTYGRHEMIALIAFLYAGADRDIFEQDHLYRNTTVGVVAKLTVVTLATLGDVASTYDCGKFALLDVDTSCIPCNKRGIVGMGWVASLSPTRWEKGNTQLDNLAQIDLKSSGEDFTTHIEPDWNNDPQCVLLAFRHRGRLVCRLTQDVIEGSFESGWLAFPQQCDRGFSAHTESDTGGHDDDNTLGTHFTNLAVVPLEHFHGNRLPLPEDENTALVIPTMHLPRARACILGNYNLALFKSVRETRGTMTFGEVNSHHELRAAIKQGISCIVAGT